MNTKALVTAIVAGVAAAVIAELVLKAMREN